MEDGDSFPEFDDGDVKVVVTGSRQYKLHAGVLKVLSPVMRDLLADENATKLSYRAKRKGITTCWRVVLIHNPAYREDTGNGIEYIFVPVALDTMGRTKPGAPAGVGLQLENGRIPPPLFRAFDAVLGACYNQPINLGDSQEHGLVELLTNAYHVTTVAEYLDCIRIITKPIEACLFATGQKLYRAIAEDPCAWLMFAARIKSRAIFKEALIHAAGKYNQPSVQQVIHSGEMPPAVTEVLVKKGKWVQKTVSTATRYLASYYPSILLREVHPADKTNISRSSYGNDIIMWIALCIFRHWITDLMADDRTHHAADSGWAFMQIINHGGDKYLAREQLQKGFHTRFPMSPKGMACVEHRLDEIKNDIKQWSAPFRKNNSSIDNNAYPVQHFLHVNVHKEDYPWVDEVRIPLREVDEKLVAEIAAQEEARRQAAGPGPSSAAHMTGPFIMEDVSEEEADNDSTEHAGLYGVATDEKLVAEIAAQEEAKREAPRPGPSNAVHAGLEYWDGIPTEDLDGIPMEDLDGTPMEDLEGIPIEDYRPPVDSDGYPMWPRSNSDGNLR